MNEEIQANRVLEVINELDELLRPIHGPMAVRARELLDELRRLEDATVRRPPMYESAMAELDAEEAESLRRKGRLT